MRRGKPLPRSRGLRRRRWMRRRPPRRLRGPGADPAYLDYIHGRPCVVRQLPGAGPCHGRIEANHAGRKPGLAMKAPDRTCLPKCSRHHAEWTEHRGAFAGWTRGDRRAWADRLIAEAQADYDGGVTAAIAGMPTPGEDGDGGL